MADKLDIFLLHKLSDGGHTYKQLLTDRNAAFLKGLKSSSFIFGSNLPNIWLHAKFVF